MNMNFPDQQQQMPYFDPLQSYHNSQDFGMLEPPGRHFALPPPPVFYEPSQGIEPERPPEEPKKETRGCGYLRITVYILLLLTALFAAGWYYDR